MVLEQITIDQLNSIKTLDALEIGAHNGGTTKYMSGIFKRVFVIDPWDGRQQGNEIVFQDFLKTTEGCDNVEYVRAGSETPQAKSFLKNIEGFKLGYCFIDGLHTKEAVINDYFLILDYLVSGSIIIVDDTNYGPVNEGADFIATHGSSNGITEVYPSNLLVNTLTERKWYEENLFMNQVGVRCFIKD